MCTAEDAEKEKGWSSLIDELLRIRRLEDGWDGEGSPARARELIDSAIALARVFRAKGYTPADRVYVGARQTIFFEWRGPDCQEEVEVFAPGEAERRWVWMTSAGAKLAGANVPIPPWNIEARKTAGQIAKEIGLDLSRCSGEDLDVLTGKRICDE